MGAGVALALLVGLVLGLGDRFWGTARTAECNRFDQAQARYDQARAVSADPTDDQLTSLQAEVARLQAECAASER